MYIPSSKNSFQHNPILEKAHLSWIVSGTYKVLIRAPHSGNFQVTLSVCRSATAACNQRGCNTARGLLDRASDLIQRLLREITSFHTTDVSSVLAASCTRRLKREQTLSKGGLP